MHWLTMLCDREESDSQHDTVVLDGLGTYKKKSI